MPVKVHQSLDTSSSMSCEVKGAEDIFVVLLQNKTMIFFFWARESEVCSVYKKKITEVISLQATGITQKRNAYLGVLENHEGSEFA